MYLEDKVYLAGFTFTLADILLYYGLHRFIVSSPVYSRAFFCIVQDDVVKIVFNLEQNLPFQFTKRK